MTIRVCYPHNKDSISSPWTIGNNLLSGLSKRGHDVQIYDWMSKKTIIPVTGDILLGHPHPDEGYIFRNSLDRHWKKKIAITPWNGAKEVQDRLDALLPDIDHMLLICGPYWRNRTPRKWLRKCTFLDMGVDTRDFQLIKNRYNPIGNRKILYIGCTLPCKGVAFLEQLISRLPGTVFGHIGPGIVNGAYNFGQLDLSDPKNLMLVKQFDFLIAPGLNDANPTTVLEAMCWGLIPICTPTSGWGEDVSMIQISREHHFSWNVKMIEKALNTGDEDLKYLAFLNRRLVQRDYNFERFIEKVETVL